MSLDLDIAVGMARLMSLAGIGVYRDDGTVFLPNEIAITVGEPPDHPSEAIGVTPYPVSDAPIGTDAILGVQLMFRGLDEDPRPVWIMRDAALDLFQSRFMFQLNGHQVGSIWRQISAPLGRDANGRYEHADSYYLNVNRSATAYRSD